MTLPDPARLLDAWERGLHLPVQRRAVALLAALTPDSSEAAIAALPLGVRDALLLDLRVALFGADLATVVACPACGETLEAGFAVDDVRVATPAAPVPPVAVTGYRIAYRPPASADLSAIPAGANAAQARATLLARCVTMHDDAGNPRDIATLPAAAVPAIVAGMAQADPQAVVELKLDCSACGHGFVAILDIAAYLLREVHHWAERMLRDVDRLARAYHWREADILALGPVRRALYLELVGG